VISGFLDQFLGLGKVVGGFVALVLGQAQPGGFEMVVGEVEAHFAELGDFVGFGH
jgi:hypothetical protein